MPGKLQYLHIRMKAEKLAVSTAAVLALILLLSIRSASAELRPANKPPVPPPPPPLVTFGTKTQQLPKGVILVPLQQTRQQNVHQVVRAQASQNSHLTQH